MAERRVSPCSGYVHPMWVRKVMGREFSLIVNQDALIELEGVMLAPNDPLERLQPGESVVVRVGQWITVESASDHALRKSLEQQRTIARQNEVKARLDAKRSESEAFNATLKLPVPWRAGIKDVLSGLSEHSMGDGRDRSTVIHIQLDAAIVSGRIRREKGDFLCTPASGDNGKQWSGNTTVSSSDGSGKPYAPKVSCKGCLRLAARFAEKTPSRDI